MHDDSGYVKGSGVTADFSRALSVDFHPMHVATNTLLFRSVIDSIINLVLAVPS